MVISAEDIKLVEIEEECIFWPAGFDNFVCKY